MCLNEFLPSKDRDRIINRTTENGKKVYKVVRVIDGRYYPLFYNLYVPFNEGEMAADPLARSTTNWSNGRKEYNAGFHFWLDRKDAKITASNIIKSQADEDLREQFKGVKIKIITCIVKKEWIDVVGIDVTTRHEARALVATRAIFPKCRK